MEKVHQWGLCVGGPDGGWVVAICPKQSLSFIIFVYCQPKLFEKTYVFSPLRSLVFCVC